MKGEDIRSAVNTLHACVGGMKSPEIRFRDKRAVSIAGQSHMTPSMA